VTGRLVIPPRARSALAYAAVFAAAGAIIPYVPLYYRSLGFGLGELGGILALGSVVGLVASPAWGALSDRRRGSPRVLVAATVTALAGTGLLALSGERLAVVAGAAVLGAGMAGLSPILDARALETAGANRSGYGPLRAWGSVSYIVSALLTGWLVEASGPRALFAVLAIALVATGLVGLSLKAPTGRPSLGTSSRPILEAGRLFGPSGLGLFMLATFLCWLGMAAVMSFTPLRFEELGAGAGIVGVGGAIAAGIEVPIMLRFPMLAARFGSQRLLVAGAIFIAARSVVAALATSPEILLGASVLSGVGFALFFVGGVTYVSEHVPRELAATAQGIFQGVGNSFSNVVAAAAGGSIAAFAGIHGLFAAAAGLGVVGTVILVVAVRQAAARTSIG
jgi:MFS transporter, PPP family, 3-phenylpropionic acid transporter